MNTRPPLNIDGLSSWPANVADHRIAKFTIKNAEFLQMWAFLPSDMVVVGVADGEIFFSCRKKSKKNSECRSEVLQFQVPDGVRSNRTRTLAFIGGWCG